MIRSFISYRLATMSGVDSNVYEARIVGLSNITKALPESPGLSVGSFEVHRSTTPTRPTTGSPDPGHPSPRR